MKRVSFDNMDFESFVAGETKIVHSMLMSGDESAVGWLRVLTLVAHWLCKTRHWPTVRGLYESIIEEVEMGEQDWLDDFSTHETMLPLHVGDNPGVGIADKTKRSSDIFWCKAFQTGGCESPSPHMSQLKPDEPAVPVLHICAHCWNTHRRRKEHEEHECTGKKG